MTLLPNGIPPVGGMRGDFPISDHDGTQRVRNTRPARVDRNRNANSGSAPGARSNPLQLLDTGARR